MSNKQSQNPMQYRVRSASRTINRCFRKRESAEAYFNKVCNEVVNDPIILEDLFANTILKDYINSQPVGVTTVDTGSSPFNNTKNINIGIGSVPFGYTEDVEVVTTTNTSDVPYIYHYKDGKLVKEELKQEVTSSREYKNGKLICKDGKLTLYGWLLKVFKKKDK